jgi:hypothetical protein
MNKEQGHVELIDKVFGVYFKEKGFEQAVLTGQGNDQVGTGGLNIILQAFGHVVVAHRMISRT